MNTLENKNTFEIVWKIITEIGVTKRHFNVFPLTWTCSP